jgi:hypothetical protein
MTLAIIITAMTNAAVSFIMMRFISSHLLSLFAKAKTGLPLSLGEIAGCATSSPRPSFSAQL